MANHRAPDPAPKICERCGKSFSYVRGPDRAPSSFKKRRYCSRSCAVSLGRTLYTRNCEHCGQEFTTHDPRKVSCTRQCGYNVLSARISHDGQYQPPLTTACIVCGKPPSSKRSLTCGPDCAKRFKAAQNAKVGTLEERLDKVKNGRTCPVCKTIFTTLNRKVKTCGKTECGKTAYRRARHEAREKRWNEALPKPCANKLCNTIIFPKGNALRNFEKQRFCSIHCSKTIGSW